MECQGLSLEPDPQQMINACVGLSLNQKVGVMLDYPNVPRLPKH